MRKFFFIWMIGLIGLIVKAQSPYNPDAQVGMFADTNNFLGFPIDPIADSWTATNYVGTTTNSLTVSATATPIFFTNYTSHASFRLFQNGHFKSVDEYGTVWQTGTNGVLSITGTNGLSLVISNWNLTISSNNTPWGAVSVATVTAGSLSGSISATNITQLTNYVTQAQWSTGSNFLATNAMVVSVYVYGTNWLQTNLIAIVNADVASAESLANGNLIVATNNVLTNLVAFSLTMSNNILSTASYEQNIGFGYATNFTMVASNNLMTAFMAFAGGTSNLLIGVSNLYGGLYVASLNTISNQLWGSSNVLSAEFTAGTNSLHSRINGSTNDFYNGPMLDFIQAFSYSIGQGASSPVTVSLHNAWPGGSYAVFITPTDQQTANFFATNNSVDGSGNQYQGGYYINNQNGTGFQINFATQTPYGLSFMVLCQWYHQ